MGNTFLRPIGPGARTSMANSSKHASSHLKTTTNDQSDMAIATGSIKRKFSAHHDMEP